MISLILIFFYQYISCVVGEAPDNKTIANYDPRELLSKIFNINDTTPRAGYGLIQFQDYKNDQTVNENIENSNYYKGKVKFYEDFNADDSKNDFANFQDSYNNGVEKKRRKKKQRQQNFGFQNPAINGPFLGLNPAFEGHYYRPPRPRPSVASSALSAVTDALTSIALYDDSQCVARLLCEAAGGGALGSSGILQTISGLQPLLTLVSAYNGISTNPLFVFGRAVFLGMSSNGNTASCRYAYPLCPTDPEQLVHYLNNHNGGFFRFFGAPELDQQNVQQFYNQLSQSYGFQPNPNYQNQKQNYGFYNPSQQAAFQTPNLYSGHQNYGVAYPYDNNRLRLKSSHQNNVLTEIQRRIQNKPIPDLNSKWTFPNTEDDSHNNYINNDVSLDYDYNADSYNDNSNREAKKLKFPENNVDDNFKSGSDRKIRGFTFPEGESVRQYDVYDKLKPNIPNEYVSSNTYYVNNAHNFNNDNNIRDIRTVYVVRGNGDPNYPEVIKLRPGETIQ